MRKPMLASILAAELALVGAAVFYHQSQADKSSQSAGSSKTYKVYSKTYKVYSKAEKAKADKEDKKSESSSKAKSKSKKSKLNLQLLQPKQLQELH